MSKKKWSENFLGLRRQFETKKSSFLFLTKPAVGFCILIGLVMSCLV